MNSSPVFRPANVASRRRPQSRTSVTRRPECALQSPSSDRKTLVWIDDYEPGLALYKMMFEQRGYRVLTASRGSAGLELVGANTVDAVVVDYEMPEMDGEAVASHLKQINPELPVVMFTGSDFVPPRVKNLVDGVCHKTGSCDQLHAVINSALDRQPATPLYAA